jgi:cyclopropane fatty-acyl-phospholipid synthase-like methyltransferase
LQSWRIDAAKPYIPAGSAVLDIGACDGVLFRRLGSRIATGVGIDPDASPTSEMNVRLIAGRFPDDLDTTESFDAITALAVFEHVDDNARDAFATACLANLKPGGRCILTVPSPMVDDILKGLIKLRVLDGMHEEEHHGFEATQTPSIFRRAGFELEKARKFQFGLNNLFVFRKPAPQRANSIAS